MHVFMLACVKHACFHVFSPFSAHFSPHDTEKGPLCLIFTAGDLQPSYMPVYLIMSVLPPCREPLRCDQVNSVTSLTLCLLESKQIATAKSEQKKEAHTTVRRRKKLSLLDNCCFVLPVARPQTKLHMADLEQDLGQLLRESVAHCPLEVFLFCQAALLQCDWSQHMSYMMQNDVSRSHDTHMLLGVV